MKLILTLLILLSTAGQAQTYPDYYSYKISSADKTTSTVTQGSFIAIPHIIAGLVSSEVKNLTVVTDWEKPFFTAWANKIDDNYSINFWGGLARIPGMKDEAHALIACHEVGHILGGSPRIKIPHLLWSSSEGQCDYYATRTCLRRYYRHLNSLRKIDGPKKISEASYTLCRTTYSDETDFLICLKSMEGIEAFAKVLSHLSQYQERPSIVLKDSTKVSQTLFDSYPSTQCRIDTLVQGALNGPRPRCWFLTL